MKLALVTDALYEMSFEEMLDTCVDLGVEEIELGCGNWSEAPHVDMPSLISDAGNRAAFLGAIRSRGLKIAALNCSGNQLAPGLAGETHQQTVEKTFQLAELLEVSTVVMMSGCPGGGPAETTVNWLTSNFRPEHAVMLRWQWEEVAIPYWKKTVRKACEHGIQKIALENHSYQLVYNPATLMKLRQEVGNVVGMNFDPSHLMWMGGDPLQAVSELGDAIHHIHAKDVRIEKRYVGKQGLLDVTPMNQPALRAWNYVALGHGHDIAWWKEFFALLSYTGYNGPVSLEMEDLTMDPLTGVKKSLEVLKAALPRCFERLSAN